jgi:hypothetical protein
MINAATPMFKFMEERHGIYLRRKAGAPKPWTSDPVLQEYRFCNVYRELDTVTIWIRENIRERFVDNKNMWFMLAIARRINHPPTLQELMADKKGAWPVKDFNPQRMVEILDARTARKEQVYTGAYMITAQTGAEHKGATKSVTTAYANLLPLWVDRALIISQLHGTLEGAFNAMLGKGFAWGPFMTYELVTDLRHTHYLREASDILTWANAGPGARRGLNLLFDRPLEQQLPAEECNAEMQAILKASRKEWPNNKNFPPLEMRDVEHSLCEFMKYVKVQKGLGRPRSKYSGRA